MNFLHTHAHSATQNDCHKGTTDTHLFGDLGASSNILLFATVIFYDKSLHSLTANSPPGTQEQIRFQCDLEPHSQHFVNSVTLIWSLLGSP